MPGKAIDLAIILQTVTLGHSGETQENQRGHPNTEMSTNTASVLAQSTNPVSVSYHEQKVVAAQNSGSIVDPSLCAWRVQKRQTLPREGETLQKSSCAQDMQEYEASVSLVHFAEAARARVYPCHNSRFRST